MSGKRLWNLNIILEGEKPKACLFLRLHGCQGGLQNATLRKSAVRVFQVPSSHLYDRLKKFKQPSTETHLGEKISGRGFFLVHPLLHFISARRYVGPCFVLCDSSDRVHTYNGEKGEGGGGGGRGEKDCSVVDTHTQGGRLIRTAGMGFNIDRRRLLFLLLRNF